MVSFEKNASFCYNLKNATLKNLVNTIRFKIKLSNQHIFIVFFVCVIAKILKAVETQIYQKSNQHKNQKR